MTNQQAVEAAGLKMKEGQVDGLAPEQPEYRYDSHFE